MGRWTGLIAAFASLCAGGCSSLYLHSPSLAERAGVASAGLTSAQLIAPFDQRAAALETFRQEEEASVIAWGVARRDLQLSRLLNANDAGLLREELIAQRRRIAGDLDFQVRLPMSFGPARGGVNPTLGDRFYQLPQLRVQALSTRNGAMSDLAAALAGYTRVRAQEGAPELADTSCKALLALAEDKKPRGGEARRRLDAAIAACTMLDDTNARDPSMVILAAMRAHVDAMPAGASRSSIQSSALYQEYVRAAALVERARQQPRENDTPQAPATALEREIAAAVAENATPSREDVEDLRGRIDELFEDFNAAADAAGWEHIEGEIEALMRANLCDAEETDDNRTARTEADCDNIERTSTAGKAQALWALALAIAHYGDVSDEDWRSPHWLAAARAIAGLRAREAALQLERERAQAEASVARLNRLVAGAASLLRAENALARPAGGCGSRGLNCALVHYAAFWNESYIPHQALLRADVHAERVYSLRLARLSAEAQAAVIEAASAQLNVYGQGGVTSEELARWIVAAGLGAAVGN